MVLSRGELRDLGYFLSCLLKAQKPLDDSVCARNFGFEPLTPPTQSSSRPSSLRPSQTLGPLGSGTSTVNYQGPLFTGRAGNSKQTKHVTKVLVAMMVLVVNLLTL